MNRNAKQNRRERKNQKFAFTLNFWKVMFTRTV